MQHRDGGAFAEHDGLEELLEIRRFDAPSDHAHELAVRSHDLAHDQDGPGAGDAAVHRLDQHVRRVGSYLESAKIGAIGDVHFGGRPCRRRVDQIAFGIDDVDAAHVGQRLDLRAQHPVDVLAGEALAIVLGACDAGRADVVDEILLDDREILQLLIEMMGEQQHGVFQLAAAVAQRALAEILRHQHRANGDRRDQQRAAHHQPADRSAAHEDLVKEATAVFRHHVDRCRAHVRINS